MIRFFKIGTFLSVFSALIFVMTAPVKAQDYAAGTTGYLYQNCKTALAESKSLNQLYNTYCGAFVEGYVLGINAVSGIKFGKPQESDPCALDFEREFRRINGKFCANLPGFKQGETAPGQMLKNAVGIAEQWINHMDQIDPSRRYMYRPATEMLYELVTPGAFCTTLGNHADRGGNTPEFTMNPALRTMEWKEALNLRAQVTKSAKQKACSAAINQDNQTQGSFNTSRCAGEITGFLSGIQVTNRLQTRPPAPQMCAKRIDRLYDAIDTRKTMCVTSTTRPKIIADVYVKNARLIPASPLWPSAAYDTIYPGWMCRNQKPLTPVP